MTAIAMETRTSQALEEWMKVFPREVTQTYTSSGTFIKQLTIVAVSTVTYLKNIFPEDNYTADQFGGLKIKVLKDKCENELAQFLITALTQAFDAFDKKYLYQIALCFYEETCSADNLLEYHVFEYAYKPEGASVRVRSGGRGGSAEGGGETTAYSFEAVKNRTLQLLRACMVMLSHGSSLPEAYDVSLRLYYNDDTPDGYQAPGFCPERFENEDALLLTVDSRVKLGAVHTPFHSLQLHTFLREMRETSASCEPQVSQTPASQLEDTASGQPSNVGSVKCECGRADRPTYTALLVCRHCGYRQHAACYGLRRSGGADVPSATHCCFTCAQRTGERAEPGLANTSNRLCFAIFRRALWWVYASEAGGVRALCGRALGEAICLGPANAQKLLKVFREHSLLAEQPTADDSTRIEVLTDNLDSVLDRYFDKEPPETDVTTRLVEESLSQRSNSDPLSDVLSPLERVCLQEASRVDTGSVSATPQPMEADPSLAQYRSALGAAGGQGQGEGAGDTSPPAPRPVGPRKRKGATSPRTGVKTKKVRGSRH